MGTQCNNRCSEKTEVYGDVLRPKRATIGSRPVAENLAKEKAAIQGVLDQQDFALSVLLEISDELFDKFMPVLGGEDLGTDQPVAEQAYYGTSQVFQRIQDQYNRTTNITEKLRILRRIAEV